MHITNQRVANDILSSFDVREERKYIRLVLGVEPQVWVEYQDLSSTGFNYLARLVALLERLFGIFFLFFPS